MYESIIIKDMIIKEYYEDIIRENNKIKLINRCKDSEPLIYGRMLNKLGDILIRIGTKIKYYKQPDLNSGLTNC